jgi:glycosyltransferase involved in cell wall biosynthesis
MELSSRRFSVVVPTRNRPEMLRRSLRALSQVVYPTDSFEVIVVNDGGGPIDEIVEPFRKLLNLKIAYQKNTGPAQARNQGAGLSGGEFLIFLDDDCAPAKNWLAEWDAAIRLHPGRALGGATENALPNNLFSSASQALLDYLYGYFFRAGRDPFVASNNLCLPASEFRALGGFSPRFPRAAAEDRDFCDAWLRSGRAIGFAPKALVYHAHRLTPAGFWRQHFNYGHGAAVFHQSRAERTGQPVRIEPLAFYGGLISFPFRSEPLPRALALSALLVASQAANAAGFFSSRLQGLLRR